MPQPRGAPPRDSGPANTTAADYPGQRLGLAATGRGSIASSAQRFAGAVIDAFVAYLVGLAIAGLAQVRSHGSCPPPTTAGTLCHTVAHTTFVRSEIESATFLVMVMLMLAFTGRTPGMLALRLQLVRLDGRRIGWLALPRTLLAVLVFPPILTDRDRRGLHDRACRTLVVHTR